MRFARIALLAGSMLILCFASSWAVGVTSDLVVHVLAAATEKPLSGATVTVRDAAGAHPALTATSDASGTATFRDLQIGDYKISVTRDGYEEDLATVTLSAGQPFTYTSYLDVVGKEKVIQVKESRLLINTHNPVGTGATRSSTFVRTRIANNNSLEGVAQTMPGVQSNSLGQFHVRGEHKGLSLSVDGVNVPFLTESATSSAIDPRFLSDFQLQTGDFDASVGGQLGAVMNVVTTSGTVKPYVQVVPGIGTLGTDQLLVRSGGSTGDGSFNYFVGAIHAETNLRVEGVDPHQQTLNNHGADNNLLVRLNGKGKSDDLGLTLAANQANLGIPQTPENYSAGVRQFQHDRNFLGVLSWRHKIDESTDFLSGLSYLESSQYIYSNGVFTTFTDAGFRSPDLAGLPVDPENPGSPYLPTTNLLVSQIEPQIELSHRFTEDNHFKAGASIDLINSHQIVDVIDAGGGGGLPPNAGVNALGQPEFAADVSRHGYLESAYFSHTLPIIKNRWILNYGLRADGYGDGGLVHTGQLSPRINMTFPISDTQDVKVSYNRIFQPPPLEIDTSGQSFALPQRANVYEADYDFQPAKDVVGRLAAVYKDYHDQVDVGLLIPNSNIPLFAPVNFGSGFYKDVELSMNTTYPIGFNGFLSATLGEARPLTPGPFDTAVPQYNDHDQRFQLSGGLSHTWANGLVAELDFLYGSGFPNDSVAAYNAVGITPFGLVGSRFSRFITNVALRYLPRDAQGHPKSGIGGGIVVENLFDDRSIINFLSGFSGTRWVPERRILFNLDLRF